MKSAGLKSSLHLARDNVSDTLQKRRKRISKPRLINSLNRINFKDGEISLNFKHNKYHHILTLQSKPQICNNDYLRSLWSEHFDATRKLKFFTFQDFTFADGLSEILVAANLIEINDRGVYLELPDSCYEVQIRELRRHRCTDISAQIIQDGKIFKGNLLSFSAQALGISFQLDRFIHDNMLDSDLPANVILKNTSEFIFTGNCDIIRQDKSANELYMVLKPIKSNIQLFQPKKVRSERVTLSPLPNIIFNHPLTDENVNLGLIDISGTGFAVGEDENNSVLMPGMVIPELAIEFAHGFRINCKAQVVYRLLMKDQVKCGVAILDMNVPDHLKLSSFLHQAKNKNSYISTTNVNLEALWDFFFETGFVYPEKYAHIISKKERFNSLYKKLYNECPEISRHVLYQDKGKIYGHVSMFRYYHKTWLMHHHAAVRSTKHKAGLVVMEHILQYINECHTLASAKMDYIACYFRPNNKFAYKVFGGAARALEDPKKCSLDEFAYFHHEPDTKNQQLPEQWSLTPTGRDDLFILQFWYKNQSDGLMLEGLDLDQDAEANDKVTNQDYELAGFRRTRNLFSLKKDDELLAIFVANQSDLGLNMSDLTNCVQIFILDETMLDENNLSIILTQLSNQYDQEELPVLIYPKDTADTLGVEYEKTYSLTVLNLDYISPYLLFMQSLTTIKHKTIKKIL